MTQLNWNKTRHHGNHMEPANQPKKKPAKGGWTHVKRQPVKSYTAEEIAAFMEGRSI